MGKLTPPPVVRVRDNEAILSLDQALRALGNAARGIIGENEVTLPEKSPRVCSQCGAPLKSNKCEYCNTEY